jgi:Methyltransferase domain
MWRRIAELVEPCPAHHQPSSCVALAVATNHSTTAAKSASLKSKLKVRAGHHIRTAEARLRMPPLRVGNDNAQEPRSPLNGETMALLTLRKPTIEQTRRGGFGLDRELIQSILKHAKPLGHHEAPANLNLGFGFLYYALVRALRPKHVLVIGSGYGFSVVCLALALKDNAKGNLTFVDPSYSVLVDGPFKTIGGAAQWADEQSVTAHFARFGVDGYVTHHRLRSEEFFLRYDGLRLPEIDIAFIDGNHSYHDVKADFTSTVRHSRRNSYILLHDTNIYVRELVRHAGVKRWLGVIKRQPELFEVVDFPFASGVAIVRVLKDKAWTALQSASAR